jgi:hypothetical protein
MRRIVIIFSIWILIAILLPALLSRIFSKRAHVTNGVYVAVNNSYWIEEDFDVAMKRIWEKKLKGPIEVRSYLWVSPFKTHFAVIKGPPRRVFLDGHLPKSLMGKAWCMTDEPVEAGLHSVVIRLPKIPPESVPLEFLLTRGLREREEIRNEQLFLEPPKKSTLKSLLIAKYLGVAARLNLVLMFLAALLIGIYHRLDPALRKSGVLFLGFFAAMLFLRFYGLTYLMEEGLHPDERVVEHIASFFRAGQLKPQSYLYTPGFHYMTAGAENLGAWIFSKDLPPHFIPRFLSALFSSLSCLLVFTIGNAVLSRTTGFIAFLLFGFAFLPIQIAHWGIIEPTMVFFFLLGVRFILKLNPDSKLKDYLIAGLASGAAVGIKQTAAIICLPFFLSYLYLNWRHTFQTTSIKRFFSWIAGAAVSYVILSPFTLLDFRNFVHAQLFQFRFLSGETHTTLYFVDDPSGFGKILEYLGEGLGYPILLAALAGCFLIWRKSRLAFLVVVPLTIIYFYVATIVHAAPYHYPLLLYPFFALLAAVTVDEIANRAQKFRILAIVILITALLIPPTMRTVQLQQILSRMDTRQQCVEWSYRNLPLGARIDYELFGPRFMIPVFRSLQIPLWTRGTWDQYMSVRIPEYVIMDSATANIFLRKERTAFPEEHEWYASLRNRGIKIKEFSGITFGQYNPHILIYKIPKEQSELSSE